MAAVVVGVSKYRDKNLKLKYAHRDAMQLAKLLNCTQKVDLGEVILLTDSAATNGKVITSINHLGRKDAGTAVPEIDYLLIFFSGHGKLAPTNEDSEGYFILHNAAQDEGDAEGLSHARLVRLLKNSFSKCSRIFVIADACHSGRFTGTDLEPNYPLLSEQHNFAGKQNRVVEFLSSQAGQISSESDQLQHGLFTYYLIRGAEGEAYNYKNEDASVEELFTYLKTNLKSEGQTPVYSGTGSFLTFDTTCLNYAKSKPEKADGKITGAKQSKLVENNSLPLKILFDTLLAQGRICSDSDTSAWQILMKASGMGEYAAVFEDMRSEYIAAVIDENADIVYKYINQDMFPWNNKFSDIEEGMLMQRSMLELLRPEELLYRNTSARYFFFESLAWYEFAKFAAGKERVKRLQKAREIVSKSIEAKSSLPTAFFLQSQVDLALNPGTDFSVWTAQLKEIQRKAPNWRLPYLYARDRASLAVYSRMVDTFRLYTAVIGQTLPLLDSLSRINKKTVSTKEITSLFSNNPVLAEDLFLVYSLLGDNYEKSSSRHLTMAKNNLNMELGGKTGDVNPDELALFKKLNDLSESNKLAEKLVAEEKKYEKMLDSEESAEYSINETHNIAQPVSYDLLSNSPLLSKKIYAAFLDASIQNLTSGNILDYGTAALGIRQHNSRGYLEVKFTAFSNIKPNISENPYLWIANPSYTQAGFLNAMSVRYFNRSITPKGRLANNAKYLMRVTPPSNPESKLLQEVNIPLGFKDRLGYYVDFNSSNLTLYENNPAKSYVYSLGPSVFVSYQPKISKYYFDVMFGAGPWLRIIDLRDTVDATVYSSAGWQINSKITFKNYHLSLNYANDYTRPIVQGWLYITAGCDLRFPLTKRKDQKRGPIIR